MSQGVAVYDVSSSAGWAAYAPGLEAPMFGVLRLGPAMTNGSNGPSFSLLYDHVAWLHRKIGIAHLGYESMLIATGTKKDDDKQFVTSPATQLKLNGMVGVLQLCAHVISAEIHPINNSSWRKTWLGSRKRGTERKEWKRLAEAKARAIGWDIKDDNDADALGQLHHLLRKLEIKPPWAKFTPSRELTLLGFRDQVPIDV